MNLKTDSFSLDSYDLVCTMAADANYELANRLDDLYEYVNTKIGSNTSNLDEQFDFLNTTKINNILDGFGFLQIQIPNWSLDSAPSRPIFFSV